VEAFEPTPGTGELHEDPMFIDPENHDYHLNHGSPAIGSGRYDRDRGALPYEATSVDDDENGLPSDYALISAYPNPFNSRAIIEFTLPETANAKLEIFNIMGQREAVLFDRIQEAGRNSALWNASKNHSGIYFARLSYGEKSASTKLVLIK
jgi:hypothetical protein